MTRNCYRFHFLIKRELRESISENATFFFNKETARKIKAEKAHERERDVK